ncbi:hypothetical protein ABZX77_11140 [Streptomyces sp. NPDC004237]|uniref:hypothetical protein n=1 Tax=Streptomyces sp. NPDC004237 TaxID=3154455 RepID=UPI0033BBE55A
MAPGNGDVGFIYFGRSVGPSEKLTFKYLYSTNAGRGVERAYSSYLSYMLAVNADLGNQKFLFSDVESHSGGFSCRLKMTDGEYKDYWLDISSGGYPQAWGSSSCRWKFVDKGPYYHWTHAGRIQHQGAMTAAVAE